MRHANNIFYGGTKYEKSQSKKSILKKAHRVTNSICYNIYSTLFQLTMFITLNTIYIPLDSIHVFSLSSSTNTLYKVIGKLEINILPLKDFSEKNDLNLK